MPAEPPKREPKPSDEPAGAAEKVEESKKAETETPAKSTSEDAAKSEKQTSPPAETKPADKPEQKAAVPTDGKSEPKPGVPADSKPADKPAQKSEISAESKPAADAQPAPATATTASNAAAAGDRVVTGDWPCWGGSIHRNMVNATTKIGIDFEPAEDPKGGKKMLWVAKLGSQTYGNPVVSGGKVWVGTNNGGEYRPKHKGDRGCVLCFDEKTGKFLWQLTREKLPQGRVNDWPEQGICSTPFVEGDRMWVVSNRGRIDVPGHGRLLRQGERRAVHHGGRHRRVGRRHCLDRTT